MKILINQLLKKEVQPLNQGVKEELRKRMDLIKKIAEEEKEDEEFFQSPSAYFKKRNLLSTKEIEVSKGVKIDLVDDEQMKVFVRDLREKIKKGGRININEMLTDNKRGLEYRKLIAYNTSVLWTYTYFWTKTKGSGLEINLPDDVIYFDDIYIGRLSSPELKKDLNKFVSKHLRERRIR